MKTKVIFFIAMMQAMLIAEAQEKRTFLHPGGLHTEADFQRMREHRYETPWRQSWQEIQGDGYAQSTRGNEANYDNIGGGGNRQAAARDAYAVYLNTLRWRIEGTTANADCAVRIINAWTSRCTIASGELFQLPIFAFVQAAEMLRDYNGWKDADQKKFKNLVRTVFLPACLDFWTHCTHESWAAPAAAANMMMGVYLDDEDVYNQAVAYFKGGDYWDAIGKPGHGNTIGSVMNVVFNSETGQIGEMGRDQPHAALGPAFLALMCQIAWNQGDDLYGFDNNRLLRGYEYYCKYNLNNPVPWTTYRWCASGDYQWFHISPSDGLRTNNSPVYEMLYNHYVVRQGLEAPYVTKMAHLSRPEEGEMGGMGYGTFCYTLSADRSPYPGYDKPDAPSGLCAELGLGSIVLNWEKGEQDIARGYEIYRSTDGAAFSKLTAWDKNTRTSYTDSSVEPGKTYYYKVRGTNTSGAGEFSEVVSMKASTTGTELPMGWGFTDVGVVASAGTYLHTLGSSSFWLSGSGSDIGGTADSHAYLFTKVKGDAAITAHLSGINWGNSGSYRRIGLVVRESLTANARRVCMSLGDDWNRHSRFGCRTTTGGSTQHINGNDFTSSNVWFRIVRQGNTFTAYQAADTLCWAEVGSFTVAMDENYYVGLASCANNTNGDQLSGTFDCVTVEGGESEPPAIPTDFKAAAKSSSTINLSWTAVPTASTYILSRATKEGGDYQVIAKGIAGNCYLDENLDFYTRYYYSLAAENRNGKSKETTCISACTDTLKSAPAPSVRQKHFGNAYAFLTWSPSGEFTESYVVKRALKSSGDYETIGSTDQCYYLDQTVSNGTRYYYRISAVNSLGEGIRYASVNGTPKADDANYWTLNEQTGKFYDVWNGAEASGTGVGRQAKGLFDRCVKMNGSGYLKLPEGILKGKSAYTISFWVNLTANTQWTRLFNFGNDVNHSMYITSKDDMGYLRYSIKNTTDSESHIKTSVVIKTGQWYHIALTQSGPIGILYLDGREVGRNTSLPYKAGDLGTMSANYFGRPLSNDPYVKGLFDDIRIYRTALAPELISLLAHTESQTLVFDNLPESCVGDSLTVHPSSSLGLPVRLISADENIASVKNDTVICPLQPGTVVLTAIQSGSLATAAAMPIEQVLTIAGTDDIDKIADSEIQKPAMLYDLSGRRVYGKPQKGFYIINHKKYILK
ncbi:MAG: alginate lyase family protein [Bacteroidaceae bacterium]|nr:alginate lyase family protein [Bacteroidaceae bacterium]